MAGNGGNWIKAGAGSVKGNVFISNKVIAKYAGVNLKDKAAIAAAKAWLRGAATTETPAIQTYLTTLASESVQPKGVAKATPKAGEAPPPPPPKGKPVKVNKFNAKMQELGLPTLAASPKTTKGSITVSLKNGESVEIPGDMYEGGLMVNKTPNSNVWNVTHSASGSTILSNGNSKAEAMALAESLLATKTDWTVDKDTLIASGVGKTPEWKAIQSAWAQGKLLDKPSTGAQGVIDSLSYLLKDAASGPAQAKAAKAAAKAKAAADKAKALAKALANKPPTKAELTAVAQALLAAQKTRSGAAIATAERTLRDIFRRVHRAITPSSDESSAMGYYQGSGYDWINGSLWAGTRDATTGALSYSDGPSSIPALMSAAKKYAAPFDMISYRSANASHPLTKWAASVKPGDLYVNKGFDSSSFSPDFDPVKGGGAAATRMVFNIPKGAKGIYFNGTPGYNGGMKEEMEWLVPANSTWRVSGVSMQNGVKVVKVDLVGQRDLDGSAIWP